MRHLNKGRKLNRTSSHRNALLNNLATALFQYKKIETTEAKAKELRPLAEKLITKAKHALLREKQSALPQGQTIDIHNRRIVGKRITNKAVLQELFDTIAPTVESRDGGYTRIVKTGTRRGDGGAKAVIELVDWSTPQDGATSLKKKKRTVKSRKPGTASRVKPSTLETPKAETLVGKKKKETKQDKIKKEKPSIAKQDVALEDLAEDKVSPKTENVESDSKDNVIDNIDNNQTAEETDKT